MTNEEKNKEIMDNPLKDWTKEQVKSALKVHSKKELLIIAMQWRMKAEECRFYYDDLMANKNKDNEEKA